MTTNNQTQSSLSDATGGQQVLGKLKYLKPTLRVYGSISALTMGSSGSAADGGSGMFQPAVMSDPATKENVVKIGEHPLGLGLYLFDYRPEFRDAHGHGRQFGVMADEVTRVMPEAVLLLDNGYRAVCYDMLGIVQTCH